MPIQFFKKKVINPYISDEFLYTPGTSLFEYAAYDIYNQKTIFFQRDNNLCYGTILNASNNLITYEDPVALAEYDLYVHGSTFDSDNNKLVLLCMTAGYRVEMKVVTISGNNMTFGDGNLIPNESLSSESNSICYDSNAKKLVCAYGTGWQDGYRGAVRIGTISGNNISYGDEIIFNNAPTRNTNVIYDANNNQVIFTYVDRSDNRIKNIIGTVSDNNINFGSPIITHDANANYLGAVTYIPDQNKIFIITRLTSWYAGIATISNNSISYGDFNIIPAGRPIYNKTTKKIVEFWGSSGDLTGKFRLGTISGNNMSYDDPIIFNEPHSTYVPEISIGVTGGVIVHEVNSNKIVLGFRRRTGVGQERTAHTQYIFGY